ncbi:hypothetical protein [Epilithonimonas vandammei]|uniref:hypothetical protein n=2 Tax=Chryseobacterium group TaxID=2782232 RepID=UPI0028978086|nr:hypothetical protein [Epilithonimonas vandammei]
MKKIIYLIGLISTFYAHAQVGINTTSPATSFDVAKSSVATVADGVLVTRISGEELKAKDATYGNNQHATLIYVTSIPTTTSPKTSNIKSPGFYYYDNTISKWVGAFRNNNFPKFFYMPSVLVNTSTLGAKSMDLYNLYYNQFNSPPVKSSGSVGSIPTLPKNELEYYVTYYDTSLMNNVSITADGVMSYNVIGNASDASFMNIVFVVK